jgi:thioredoxin 1
MTLDVTDETFEAEVLTSELPVIVDFWAPWCRPCKAIERSLAEIAEASEGQLRLVKLDIDTNLRTPAQYGVLSIPTVILFKHGEVRETIVGARPKGHFERAFAPHL